MITGTKFKSSREGVFYDLPESVYRRAPGINQSILKPLSVSPAHFQHALANPMKATAEMTFGKIGHHLLFTPKAPKWWAARPPGLDLRTPEGKKWKAKHLGREWVDFQTYLDIAAAVNAVETHADFKAAAKSKVRELSIFRRISTPYGRVMRKCRIDLVPTGISLCDVKFVEDATQHGFSNAILGFMWYLQAAYYLDIYNDAFPNDKKTQFVFFAVEKTPPYPVVTHILDQGAIVQGRTKYIDLLNLYMDCRDNNQWPKTSAMYPDAPVITGLPKWANKGQAQKGDFIFQ